MAKDYVTEALQFVANLMAVEIAAAMAAFKLEGSELQKSVTGYAEGRDTVVISMNRYGEWVISGRKAGVKKVPIQALLDWIKRKGIRGRSKGGRFIKDVSLAFAIQNSIYKKGITGRDFLTSAILDNYDKSSEILVEALYKELEYNLTQAFKQAA